MHAAFDNAGRVKGLELWRIEVIFLLILIFKEVSWVAKHKYWMTNVFVEKKKITEKR